MTLAKIEIEEEELLARARRELAPAAGAAERVRVALTAALAPKTPLLEEASDIPVASTAARNAAFTPSWVSMLAVSVAVAAAAGSSGYYFGFRAGAAESPSGPGHVRPVPSAVAVQPVVVPSPNVVSPHADREPEETPALPGRPRANTAPSTAPATPGAGDPSLWAETRLMARIERALRSDNPSLALGLLGELERTIPGGQLREEREAARALGRCALASSPTPEIAEAFAKRHPGSAYLPRIAEACGRNRK
jgi:hypothetical protein